MKKLLAVLLLAAALLTGASAFAEQAPLLTLLFSANSFGSVRPCPT